MSHTPLISLITTCYNGERFIEPYIRSLLSQTYENVEYIFVNDGSSDKTEDILMSYKPEFLNKGWHFIYHKHDENVGLATAMNSGLKLFTGEYLTWIDSDDLLNPTFLSEMCSFLEQNSEYGFCYSRVKYVREGNLTKGFKISGRNIAQDEPDNFFEDMLIMKNMPALPFCMVRSSAFLDVIKDRRIFETRQHGKNFQLLLPLSYKYKCGYINKVLARYLFRSDSISHGNYDQIDRLNQLEAAAIETVKRIDMPKDKKLYYCKRLAVEYYIKRETVRIMQQDGGVA